MARSLLQVGSFFVLTAAGLGVVGVVIPGCSSPFSGCEASRTCLPSGGTGDSEAGAPGDAGSSGDSTELGDAGRRDGASGASGNTSGGGAGGDQATTDGGAAGTAISGGEGGTTSDGGASSSEGGAGGEAGASGDVCQVFSIPDISGTPCTCAANNVTNGHLENDQSLTPKTYYCH